MAPPLTVIIPSYNRHADTARSVASACAETPSDAEILVIDDGSTPALADVSPDPRVRVIRHDENRGAAAARNSGLNEAKGDWIAFLDSDDIWPAGSFNARWAVARADTTAPSLTVFVGAFTHLDEADRRRTRWPASSYDPKWFASGCWFCPGSTALFRRAPILDAIGVMDASLRRLEDLDWFLRLALRGGGVRASAVVAAQIARSSPPRRALLAQCRVLMLAKYADLAPPLRARLSAYLEIELAASARSEGHLLVCAAHLARSWLQTPRTRLHLEDFWPSPKHLPRFGR